MEFRIVSEDSKKAVTDYIQSLSVGRSYSVSIKVDSVKRSLRQNALYWKWVGIIATETGNDTDTISSELRRRFLGYEVVVVFDREVEKIRGTHSLSKSEFTIFLDKVSAFAHSELGITLPFPEDTYFDLM